MNESRNGTHEVKIVISCAGSKSEDAGRMMTADGKPVEFVAHPNEVVKREPEVVYARPDDHVDDDGLTWRDRLLEYNESQSATNPLDLVPTYKLYRPRKPHSDVYERLVSVFGPKNVYILSAGWGLVNASFLLPKYDITFNSSADRWKRRGRYDEFDDFNQLAESSQDLLFVGGQGYWWLFYVLSENYNGRRIVYFNSKIERERAGIRFEPVPPSIEGRTWHYQCAKKIAESFESARRDFDPLAVTW